MELTRKNKWLACVKVLFLLTLAKKHVYLLCGMWYDVVMKDSWEKFPYYAHLTPYEVVIGSNPGKRGMTDNAGSCTYEEFLAGEYQDMVRKDFGEDILQEMIESVKEASGNGATIDTRMKAARDKDTHHLKQWKKIPINTDLALMALNADEDGYSDNYGHGPNGTTVVQLTPNVSLTLGSMGTDAFFTLADDSILKSEIPTGPAIGHNGFATVAANDIRVFDATGALTFTTGGIDEGMNATHGIGSTYRVNNVLRKGDTIIVEYRNSFALLKNSESLLIVGGRGFLEIDPHKGVIARCPMKEAYG